MKQWIYAGIRLILFVFISVVPLANLQAGAGHPLIDFETGVPYQVDDFNNGLGLVPWGNAFENVTLSARQVVPGGALATGA